MTTEQVTQEQLLERFNGRFLKGPFRDTDPTPVYFAFKDNTIYAVLPTQVQFQWHVGGELDNRQRMISFYLRHLDKVMSIALEEEFLGLSASSSQHLIDFWLDGLTDARERIFRPSWPYPMLIHAINELRERWLLELGLELAYRVHEAIKKRQRGG